MSSFKLTIVTVVFNDVGNISRTIESVLKHKSDFIEYLVIDGFSSDGTIEKVRQYESEINSFISEPDTGIYDAMNKGLQNANGDSIIFMNSGDVFAEGFDLRELINEYDLKNEIVIGFSVQTFMGDSYLRPGKTNIQQVIDFPAHQAIFVPQKRYKEVQFNSKLKIAADYYWIKDVMRETKVSITKHIISEFSLGGKSSSKRFKDIYLVFKEMNASFCLLKSISKFILFNTLGQKMAFRIIYRNKYSRL
jgi:glycosyltransferase involved in cell wall biosynthesis